MGMNRRVNKKIAFFLFIVLLSPIVAIAQVHLRSIRFEYYSALALIGFANEPSLGYISFDDATWQVEGGPWRLNESISFSTSKSFHFQLVDTIVTSSWNSKYPHGGNDGALWQGVGSNLSAIGGAKLSWLGASITIYPEIALSENSAFKILPTVYPESDGFGYFRPAGMDVYQRPGDDPVYYMGWGDSEFRFSINELTIGFGSQNVWIGPGRHNAIILSNNSTPFPKFDIGLRRTSTLLGDIEVRSFVGFLEESEYFDKDTSNDSTTISLFSASFAPKFLPGLTLGFHRSILSKGTENLAEEYLKLFAGMGLSLGRDEADQRASVSIRYAFPEVGFETYVEWAKNDYSPNLDFLLRYPFHAHGYTIGARKATNIADGSCLLVIAIEVTNVESSRDYEFLGPYSFYGHGYIKQGYTNYGQIIGAAVGTGGNGQYFDIDLYFPDGKIGINASRVNRDNDHVYFNNFGGTASEKKMDEKIFNAEITIGLDVVWRSAESIVFLGGFEYCRNLNPLYNPNDSRSTIIDNIALRLGIEFWFQ